MPLSEEGAIEQTIKALRSRRFDARFARSREIARDMVLELVPLGTTIGIGDSSSLRQIEVIPELEAREHQIVNPFRSSVLPEEGNVHSMESMLRQSLGKDIYITGANVVTMDGQIVSVDGAGNRVAGMIFGAPKVIVVLGQNKIVADLEAALERIKKVIAPAHAKNRGFHTPCASTGECTDCRGKNRICSIIAIMESKPMMTELSVVIVGEDLGLGWDPDWPSERIDKIRKAHNEKAWRPAMNLRKL